MSRKTPKDLVQAQYGTYSQASRFLGVGEKWLRKRGAAGAFPVYTAETKRLRVKFSEVEGWFRSTRVPVTNHAHGRVEEVLAREERRGV